MIFYVLFIQILTKKRQNVAIFNKFQNDYFSINATEARNDPIFEIPGAGIDFSKLIEEHILIHFMSFGAELSWAEVDIFS